VPGKIILVDKVRHASVHTAPQLSSCLISIRSGFVPMGRRGPRNTIPYCQGCPSKVMSLFFTYSTSRVSTPTLLKL